MTYSRPGIRQTNANAGVPNPDRIRIANSPYIKTGAGPSYSDRFVNASIAGKNEGQDEAAIASFLQNIQEPFMKVADSISVQNANREVGQLVADNPDLPELFRTSSENVQDKIRSLSPRAQDIFLYNSAVSSGTAFQKTFATSVAADALLAEPTTRANEEAQTKRYAELRADAMESSGVSRLPANYVGAISGELATFEGSVQGQLQEIRIKKDAAAKGNAEAAFWGATLEKDAAAIPAVDGQLGDQVNATSAAAQKLNGMVAARIEENLASGNLTPTQTLTRVWQGTSQQIVEALNDGDTETARQLLTLLETAAEGEVRVGKEGLNFWDLRIPGANGTSSSLQDKIRTTQKAIDRAETEGSRAEALRFLADYLPGLTSADPEERQQAEAGFRAALNNSGLSPLAVMTALELQQTTAARGAATTGAQIDAFTQLTTDPNYINGTPGQRIDMATEAYNNGSISQGQWAQELNGVRGETDQSRQIISQIQFAQTVTKEGTVGTNVSTKLAEETRAFIEATGINPSDPEAVVKDRIRVVEGRALIKTKTEIETGIARGETYDEARVTEIYQTNLKIESDKEITELREASGRTGSVKQVVQSQLKLIEARIKEDPEAVKRDPMQMFPPGLVEEFREVNKRNGNTEPDNWRSVFKYFAGRLTGIQDEKGSYMFGENQRDSQKWFREWYFDVLGEEPKNQGLDSPALRSPYDVPTSNKGSDEKSDGIDITSTVLDGLSQLAGAVLPGGGSPANAGTLTENQENLLNLAAAYSGRAPVSLATPPLPQVAAGTQTQSVPLAIRTSNHPFSIAIGIAEGTRTPSGGMTKAYYGHTDPGNGASNAGTYSAQQGMPPGQADAYWNGKLTQTQMRVSPLLEAAGIKRGTQGYNRLMFNVLDLSVQAPAALPDFLYKIPEILRGGLTVEAIAKARSDSFYNPRSKRLDAPGFGNNYQRLFRDQRSRAGVWDYRRRI